MTNHHVDLATALRRVLWEDRSAVEKAELHRAWEALHPLLMEVASRLHPRFPRVAQRLSPEDIVHDILKRWMSRPEPLGGLPPPSPPAARAYVTRAVRNHLISLHRRFEAEATCTRPLADGRVQDSRPASREDAGGNDHPDEEPAGGEEGGRERVRVSRTDILREMRGEGEADPGGEPEEWQVAAPEGSDAEGSRVVLETAPLPSDEAGWRRDFDKAVGVLVEDLRGLKGRTQDAEWEVLVERTNALARAIREEAEQGSSPSSRIRFRQGVIRLVRCRFAGSTMEAEVRREAEEQGIPAPEKGSADYRRLRNRLDQHNKRVLDAISRRLVVHGMDEGLASRMVKVLGVRFDSGSRKG